MIEELLNDLKKSFGESPEKFEEKINNVVCEIKVLNNEQQNNEQQKTYMQELELIKREYDKNKKIGDLLKELDSTNLSYPQFEKKINQITCLINQSLPELRGKYMKGLDFIKKKYHEDKETWP